MSLTREIKEFALDLGYSRVGVTTAESFPDYIRELEARGDKYDWYVESTHYQPKKGAAPREGMPAARSIVVAVLDYYRETFPEALVGKVGRLYQSRSYLAPPTRIHGARRQLLAQYLTEKGCAVDTRLTVPVRAAAARAGQARVGRNTFACVEGMGTFINITTFVVDKELEYDSTTLESHCPKNCRACLDACPTQAIYEPFRIDPRRCIAFNTFVTREGVPHVSTYIPPEIRTLMGTWIYGCDVCQEACPKNQVKLKAKLPQSEFLETLAADFSLAKIVNLTDEYYARRVQPIMYNYIREKKYFQRNAAIALGNQGDPAVIPDLEQALANSEEMVRGYAAWALGKIGGSRAKQALEAARLRETADQVRREMEAALAA
jgi:epoxyqueuosine reductase